MLCQMSLQRVSFSIKLFQFVLFHERYNMQGTSLPEIAASYYAEYKTKVEAHVNLTIKYKLYRWLGAALLTLLFLLRIIISRKYFMITYFLYVYILVAFVAFITPFEEAEGGLPINDTEDKGYRRNLPEFDFWRKYTTAHLIAFSRLSFHSWTYPSLSRFSSLCSDFNCLHAVQRTPTWFHAPAVCQRDHRQVVQHEEAVLHCWAHVVLLIALHDPVRLCKVNFQTGIYLTTASEH